MFAGAGHQGEIQSYCHAEFANLPLPAQVQRSVLDVTIRQQLPALR